MLGHTVAATFIASHLHDMPRHISLQEVVRRLNPDSDDELPIPIMISHQIHLALSKQSCQAPVILQAMENCLLTPTQMIQLLAAISQC